MQSKELDIDGGEESIYAKFESFISSGDIESHGQAAASSTNNFQQSSDTKVTQAVKLFMSQKDSYIVAASKRKFPFDNILATPATTLQVSLYGKEAMANTATLAVSWTSITR